MIFKNTDIFPMFALRNDRNNLSQLHKVNPLYGGSWRGNPFYLISFKYRFATTVPAYINNCKIRMRNENNNYRLENNSTQSVTDNSRNEEIQNLVNDFLFTIDPSEAKKILHEFFLEWTCSDEAINDSKGRENILFLYRTLQKLLTSLNSLK